MSLGSWARRSLGPRFHGIAERYRAFFVDLAGLGVIVAAELPQGATVLDIGAGDGAVLNYVLARRPDLRVIMVDTAANIGGAIESRYLPQLTLMPLTTLAEYNGEAPDAIVVLDVLHHIPLQERPAFFSLIGTLAERYRTSKVIVKEVEPKGLRSRLGWLSDRFVTGDRNVRFISRNDLTAQLEAALGAHFVVHETPLFQCDAPNYCMSAVRVDRR